MRALPYFTRDDYPTPPEIEAYLAERRRTGAAPSTVYATRRDLLDLASYVEEATGAPFAARVLSTDVIRDYRDYLRVRRLSSATINRRTASIRGFCRYATARGWLPRDPTEHIKPARLTRPPAKSLEPDEHQRLMIAVERATPRDAAIINTMLLAGLRVSEVAHLETSDVDLGAATVWVRAGKGNRDRVVPANAELLAALGAYLAVRPVSAERTLFLASHGGGFGVGGLQALVRSYGQRARIAGLSPHRLRHHFCRSLLRAGIDIVTVRDLMGHASVATTQLYGASSAQDMRAAVERLTQRGADL
jgi:site-specific recombinase XerD